MSRGIGLSLSQGAATMRRRLGFGPVSGLGVLGSLGSLDFRVLGFRV